ncbi:TonB-dependent receptor domain-containing protein [Aeromonas hydrophila]|uniref:TonB-dependent receptor domain-containing protein n=1 Tax=Aeromonas hydrophila TaxID=644 RepID=UPI0005D86D49|nr:TonB-dependent receptor [Aeromonas hydrophila]AKA15478.1 ligand-gated channel protein [Aeromonas hydrophila]HAT2248551.1 TonB-dependent receptor [Aeromonas hydrophila]HAT2384080.1 TonB-dependent receptor [Aeromonas hydrophila]HAT2416368.1 TonB-dependent receptor [Aeromonas hydrophila]HAT2527229.1 TonB-dependent receptor [Aeromonas hydrophila]
MSKKLLAAALLPTAAFAQTTIPVNPTLVITANRVEQPISSVLAPVVVIDRAEIESRQVQSLPALLKTLPGVQITTLGGRGHMSSLFIRGTNSNHSLVLMNGRPIAAMVAGTPDLSQIPLGNIERIEYIRGPRAAVYGSDAIGGVINLITKTSAKNGSETHLKGGVGSNGYGQGQLRTVQALGQQTDMNMMIGYERTDGFDVVANAQQPDGDGFDSLNGQFGLNHAFNDAWSADFNAQGYDNQTEMDDAYQSADQSRVQAFQYDGGLKYQSGALSSRLEASYGENKLKSWLESKGESSAEPIHTGLTRFSWINSWSGVEGLNLTGGADWQQEQLKSDTRSYGQAFNAPDRDNTGLFVVGSYRWQALLWELSGRTDDNKQYGRHNTWSAASGLDLDDSHTVRLSYGTAFKAPTFLDLYYPGYENPALKPEESKNLELGFNGRYTGWDWSLNLYRNQIQNLIACQSASSTCRPDNTDAEIRGVEVALGLETGPLRHDLSFDYTRAEDKNDGDQQLLRRAKQKASWLTQVQLGPVDLSTELLYVGKRDDKNFSSFPAERVELGSYTLINLGASYGVTPQFTLGGRIDNLFDRDYAPAYGYASAGTEFKLTADYRL